MRFNVNQLTCIHCICMDDLYPYKDEVSKDTQFTFISDKRFFIINNAYTLQLQTHL